MNVREINIGLVVIDDSTLDDEYIPLCPFCDCPIDGGATIVKHSSWGDMCLVHSSCLERDGD